MSDDRSRAPRDNLIRALAPAPELKAGENVDGPPKMVGMFSPFNEWTEINSVFEGRFLERFAPGAFKKTIRESRDDMQVLFQHGMDPQVGDKPLGTITNLYEDQAGAHYEVELLDARYVSEDVLPGLKAGLYGSSHRFGVKREEWVDDPEPSDYNPNGLPERTVKEAAVAEFGPVTFPAYKGATAGMRSLTDAFLVRSFEENPAMVRAMFEARMDSEDAGTLAQMIACASMYIEDQDESDEAGNVTEMQAIQASLIKLLNVEASETEPVEPEDEQNSTAPSGQTPERREPDPPAPASNATRKGSTYLKSRKDTPSWAIPVQ